MVPACKLQPIDYAYRNAPVPGGGFVTGFVFHPRDEGILYARTDIGGVYRFDFAQKRWTSLVDHVTAPEKWECNSLSLALDPTHPDRLYIISGDWDRSFLCRSEDRGESFEYFKLPGAVHGNASGRGTGERLLVDPVNPDILYIGTQRDGLFISQDRGKTYRPLPVQTKGRQPESDIAFIAADPRSGNGQDRCQTLFVATSGKENSPDGHTRAESLYYSRDGGQTFDLMPGQPKPLPAGNFPGFVGQRCCLGEDYLYVTMAAVAHSWAGWHGYACDMGGRQQGLVLRYQISADGQIQDWQTITPDLSFLTGKREAICSEAGFGGICADPSQPHRLICSTQCYDIKGDTIFFSQDRGESWKPIMHDLDIGVMDFASVPYMKPEYNDGANLIHWMSDLKIDPFCPDRAVFNTGTGIFMSDNLSDAATDRPVTWRPVCDGVEETVHLNVYSPPAGDVMLIDIIGDLGGFAFKDLTRPAENSFADAAGNRYITCLNADFTDAEPRKVAVTARGNWKGKTTGGLIWSEDQCETWTRLADPMGLSPRIDGLIAAIRQPNTNSGWTALASDGKTLVWCVGEGQLLPAEAVVYTEDLGQTWHKSQVLDISGRVVGAGRTLKVLADRVNPEWFYGFGDDSTLYRSTDRARTFRAIRTPQDFPCLQLGGMDTRIPAEIRTESGREGIVWIATGPGGLWKISCDFKSEHFTKISAEGDVIYRQGMGCPAPGSDCNTLYVNGMIDGEYGFWRSLNEGKSWQRINRDDQMYGLILSICGDPRTYGRFYIASGSRGVLWGEPVN